MSTEVAILIVGIVLAVCIFATRSRKPVSTDQIVQMIEETLATKRSQEEQLHQERHNLISQTLQNNASTSNTMLQSVINLTDTVNQLKQKQVESDSSSNIKGSLGNALLEQLLTEVYGENTKGTLWDLEFSMDGIGRPDAVVHYKDTYIPIDSKNLKDDYIKYLDNEINIKQVAQTIGKSVKDISKYVRPDFGTSSYAILLIPSEQMYYDIMVKNSTNSSVGVLRKECIKHNILICSPSTLYVELGRIMDHIRTQTMSTEVRGMLEVFKNVDETYTKFEAQLEAWEVRFRNISSENTTLLNTVRSGSKKIKSLKVYEKE